MKPSLALAALSLSCIAHPALAQPRPFRLTLGGALTPGTDTGWLGLSLDVKRLRQGRTLSVFGDSGFTLGFGCGTSVLPGAPPADRYAGMEGYGLSLRQPYKQGWLGVGVGGYRTFFSDCGAVDRTVTGMGAKLFAGVGGGLYFSEVTLTVPSVPRYSQLAVTVGLRL